LTDIGRFVSEVPAGDIVKRWHIKKNTGKDIKVEVVKDGTGLTVKIELLNHKCNVEDYSKHFESAALKMILSQRFGPDEIIIELMGPSLQTKVALTRDFCNNYYASFVVPISGHYRLKVFRTRQHYTALKEIPKFPKITIEFWVDDLISYNLEKYIPGKACDAKFSGLWSTDQNTYVENPYALHKYCPGTGVGEAHDGRGLPPMLTYVQVSAEFTGSDKCSDTVDRYLWNTMICLDNNTGSIGEVVDTASPNVTDTRLPSNIFSWQSIRPTYTMVAEVHPGSNNSIHRGSVDFRHAFFMFDLYLDASLLESSKY